MKEYKHIMLADRRRIEELYNNGMMPVDIAAKIGVHHATIYNELRRGDTGKIDGNGRIGYSAELAQNKVYNRRRLKQQTAARRVEELTEI
jgi:IS30 family transposase